MTVAVARALELLASAVSLIGRLVCAGSLFVVTFAGCLLLGWWRRNGEDPDGHSLVFSDALDLRDMSALHDAFGDRAKVTFGWGTNLTNDLGFEPLSLVVKPDSVDGIPCVKLSDDLAKATGPRDEIERYKRLVRPA